VILPISASQVVRIIDMSYWHLAMPGYFILFFVVLGFELRAYTLSHSTALFL
jgi:hypothetical protein